MLKKVLINGKLLPVPVPLKTLGEVMTWIEQTLVPQGQWITRVSLNGKVMKGIASDLIDAPHTLLNERHRLEVQVESPHQLSIQALEAIHNLANVIVAAIRPAAVDCWQAKPVERPRDLDVIRSDLELEVDLIRHLSGLRDSSSLEMAPVLGAASMIAQLIGTLDLAVSNSDWRACAKLILNRLEPVLKDLVAESEKLHLRLLSTSDATGGLDLSKASSAAGGQDGRLRS